LAGRIVLEIPGELNPKTVELGSGETLVVGRDPAPAGALSPGAHVVQVSSPSVSKTHVAIKHAEDGYALVDERSRNGTWVRLPPGDPVVVRTQQSFVVRLGSGARSEVVEERPADATWTGRSDFHTGVAKAIADWFAEQGVPARVATLPRTESAERELYGRIPLANGFDVSVVPLRTMDHRWERMAGSLWSYAGDQNAIFTMEEHARGEGMVLASAAIRRVHRIVVDAAQRGVRLLLVGPSGAGKDGLARSYHRNSGRPGAFVSRNCSMFSREFLRTELFGAEKGAYTGATRTTVGAVERAHGGTLFLDEIGDLPPEVQAMLLTFLDNGEYERFGANGQPRKADVRIVSATNRDLRHAVASHVFREDLWYRIAGQVVEVPPLRERPDDVEAFLRLPRTGGGLTVHDALTPAARQLLLGYAWPGNFRELRSFVDRMPTTSRPESVDGDACNALLRAGSSGPQPAAPAPQRQAPMPPSTDLAKLAGIAAEAFRTDAGHEVSGWDDVKQYVESYLKPLIFAALSGIAQGPNADADIASLAHLIDADRGTVRKHLARFLERFAKLPPDGE